MHANLADDLPCLLFFAWLVTLGGNLLASLNGSGRYKAQDMRNKGDVKDFDRQVALRQLFDAGNRRASLAGSLRSIGAMEEPEFNSLRSRPKVTADVADLDATRIRRMAEAMNEESVLLDSRREAALRLLAEDAGVAYVPRPIVSKKIKPEVVRRLRTRKTRA